jgi:hypothetical protein
VVPLTRVDHNFANGIVRGMAESRASMLIIGWDGKQSHRRGVFGSVLDQLLEQTWQQVLVAKVGHPLNTLERVILLIPLGADYMTGFQESLQTVKQLASRLSAEIVAYTVDAPEDVFLRHLETTQPEVPVTAQRLESWNAAFRKLAEILRRDDLVVVLSARRGALAWDPALERLPGHLAALVPESFIMLYPSEAPVVSTSSPSEL